MLDIFESVIDRNEIESYDQQGIIWNELCYIQRLFPLFVFSLKIESRFIVTKCQFERNMIFFLFLFGIVSYRFLEFALLSYIAQLCVCYFMLFKWSMQFKANTKINIIIYSEELYFSHMTYSRRWKHRSADNLEIWVSTSELNIEYLWICVILSDLVDLYQFVWILKDFWYEKFS